MIKKKKNRRSDGKNHIVAVSEPKKVKTKDVSKGENHIVVVSEPKKVKTKDVSKGENLFEPPKDEIFDALPSHFQERSSVLIEPTQPINLGIEEHPHMIHLA